MIIHHSFQILRNCSQLKCLKVQFLDFVNELEFADLFFQPADNIVDLELTWMLDPFIEGALTIFKRWRYLHRLILLVERLDFDDHAEWPALNAICDFILDVKSLRYLHIDDIGFDEMEKIILEKIVNDRVKPHRPDFVFEMFPSKACSSGD